ncbi:cobalt transport protein CbiN [Oxobacter pfennigii]|uniref:Cobalt transport protein CbiN n=1 Tax=Oxobacter pfennigii TaxID=36849 RepID=A0A0P8W455_9CLOT|nr:energy-coupling factor ABC transporter substrate-binding protein [Oxobacter pfennigii]KPU43366.1 cobalt transport protein CbiN [Oxobacter pfennigii]
MQSQAVNKTSKGSLFTTNLLLLLLVVVITVVPLIIAKDAEFGGADGEAEEAITEINTEYEPWFSPIYEPPSGEIESLLFSSQAALGAGIIGYGIGYFAGRKKGRTEHVHGKH